MRKILVDKEEDKSLIFSKLPIFIHGLEGSGASIYTIILATKYFLQGYKILFLCGYPMAEEAFSKEVGNTHHSAKFFTKEKVQDFLHALNQEISDETIIVVKNIELFGEEILEAINRLDNIIISGDITQSRLKGELAKKKFETEIYFSHFEGKSLPQLEKYTGYILSDNYSGVTSLK